VKDKCIPKANLVAQLDIKCLDTYLRATMKALPYLPRTVSIPESTNSSLDGGNLPTRAVSRSLSTLTIWETLATESLDNPVKRAARWTFPGARAHFGIGGQRNADDGGNAAPIEGVTLHHNDRPAETRARTCWRGEVRPPDLALRDYHSLRSRVRRAAEETNGSFVSPASAHARFMASVTSSGAW
jgi:hypothetical protein